MDMVCPACAHECHLGHALELRWTLEDTISKECDCFNSQKCNFIPEEDEGEEEDNNENATTDKTKLQRPSAPAAVDTHTAKNRKNA
jgi:hypothetical protein